MPGTTPQLAEATGISREKVQELVDRLFVKGLAFSSGKTDPPSWRMCRDFVQFHDASILWPQAPQKFLDLWQEFMDVDWPDLAKKYANLLPRPFTRVIPVNVSVAASPQILALENVREIVEKARALAVTKCTCRLTAHKCDRPLEVCLQVNRAAEYSIKRGTGKPVSKEEALDILRRSEEEGLIHVTMNKNQVDHFICNCCPCCCQTMPVLIKGGTRVIDPSRFQAAIDPEKCTACGTCLDRCYFGAITLREDQGADVSPENCMGCGLCAVTCPEEAIALNAVRPETFIPENPY
jgi:Pyruvate/2-oxoacid:ferredoxin oxidoreductase delta subunit